MKKKRRKGKKGSKRVGGGSGRSQQAYAAAIVTHLVRCTSSVWRRRNGRSHAGGEQVIGRCWLAEPSAASRPTPPEKHASSVSPHREGRGLPKL